MRILITGGNGFVGKALCNKIKTEGYCPVVYDLPNNDILNSEDLNNYVSSVDMVIHCAAIADLNESDLDRRKNFYVNVLGTYEVAEACDKHKKKMIYISTCCVYGNCIDNVETEDSLPIPTECYANSKLSGEYVVKSFIDLDFVIARIGTVYGPGMRKTLFNFIAIDKIMKNEPITIHGNGFYTRNYVYIDDLADGLIKLIRKWHSCNTFNICGTESTSVLETVNVIYKITGLFHRIEFVADRRGQIDRENISNQKSVDFLGCKYRSYVDGMKETIKWYMETMK